jgi:hypothetical protein
MRAGLTGCALNKVVASSTVGRAMDDILEGKVFRVSLFVWLVADVDLL